MLKLVDEQKRCEQIAKAQEDYAEIVYRLAIGDDPRLDQVFAALSATGKSAVDLSRDVAAQRQTKTEEF